VVFLRFVFLFSFENCKDKRVFLSKVKTLSF